MNKTVAEKLREKPRDQIIECHVGKSFLGVDCSKTWCADCFQNNGKALADIIEAEQAELRERVDECNNTFIDLAALDLLCDKLDCGDANHRATAEQIRKAMKGVKPQNWAMAGLLEGVNVPFDAEGQPCCLDDGVYYKDRLYLVVAISHKGKVCIRDWEKRDRGDGAVWVKAERVTHRKPDTLEDLQRDAEEFVKSLGDGRNAMYVFDLLKRQRKLMGGE